MVSFHSWLNVVNIELVQSRTFLKLFFFYLSGDMITEVLFNSTVVPDPPHTLMVDFNDSRVVNISWTAGFDGKSPIENYTVEISQYNQIFKSVVCQGSLSSSACVVSSSSTNTSLTGLLPWTTYNIRVFATNAIGKSNSSQILIVTTDEEGTCMLFNLCISLLCIKRITWIIRTWVLQQGKGTGRLFGNCSNYFVTAVMCKCATNLWSKLEQESMCVLTVRILQAVGSKH